MVFPGKSEITLALRPGHTGARSHTHTNKHHNLLIPDKILDISEPNQNITYTPELPDITWVACFEKSAHLRAMLPPAGRKYVRSLHSGGANCKSAFGDPSTNSPHPAYTTSHKGPVFHSRLIFCVCMHVCMKHTQHCECDGQQDPVNTSNSLLSSLWASK